MYKTTENHVSIHLVPFISSCCSYWLCLLFVVVFLSLCLFLKSCFVADDSRERLKIPIVIENKSSDLVAFHSTTLSLIPTDEGRSPSVTLHFESDICHFVELSETSKSLKWFLPMGLWSRVMAFSLNFWPFFEYRAINQIKEFWPEISSIDWPNHL